MGPLNGLLCVFVLLTAVAGCSGGEDDPTKITPPNLPRRPPSAIEDHAEDKVFERLIFNGADELVVRVWSDEPQSAPFTAEPCAYWWSRIAYETETASHGISTRNANSPLLVEVGGELIEVDQARWEMAPTFRETFAAGEEPERLAVVDWGSWGFPEATFNEWTLAQGGSYRVRVEVYGSAYLDENEEVVYGTHYHYYFLGPASD